MTPRRTTKRFAAAIITVGIAASPIWAGMTSAHGTNTKSSALTKASTKVKYPRKDVWTYMDAEDVHGWVSKATGESRYLEFSVSPKAPTAPAGTGTHSPVIYTVNKIDSTVLVSEGKAEDKTGKALPPLGVDGFKSWLTSLMQTHKQDEVYARVRAIEDVDISD
jgi:hypothetical protein